MYQQALLVLIRLKNNDIPCIMSTTDLEIKMPILLSMVIPIHSFYIYCANDILYVYAS